MNSKLLTEAKEHNSNKNINGQDSVQLFKTEFSLHG